MSAAAKIPEPTVLSLDKIRLDGGTQSRERLNKDRVAQYAETLSELPPVVVFHDGTEYWLAAGFHRVAAFKSKDRKRIPADVREGTIDDAKWFAAASNKEGDKVALYRSQADKRKDVFLALSTEHGKTASARSIAEHVGVSNVLVSELRKQVLKTNTSEPVGDAKVTGKDGKQYPATRPKPQKPEAANDAPPAEPPPRSEPRASAKWSCPRCGTEYPVGVYPEHAQLCGQCADTTPQPAAAAPEKWECSDCGTFWDNDVSECGHCAEDEPEPLPLDTDNEQVAPLPVKPPRAPSLTGEVDTDKMAILEYLDGACRWALKNWPKGVNPTLATQSLEQCRAAFAKRETTT